MTPILLDFARKSGFTLCKEESALREMLEQFAKFIIEHEASKQPDHAPIAWAFLNWNYGHVVWGAKRPDDEIHTTPLYTTPPAAYPEFECPRCGHCCAQRQPLTDEQIDDIWNRYCDEMGEASINDAYDIARAIEAAHGITGEEP